MKKGTYTYLCSYLIILIVIVTLLIIYPKAELHMLMNSFHNSVLDEFFRYYSTLAEWPFYAIALLPILIRKWLWTAFYALCEISCAIIVQVIKAFINAPRPSSFFSQIEGIELPVVENVNLHSSYSFPSGHTSTFFVFFTFCALLLIHHKKKAKKARMAKEMSQETTQQNTQANDSASTKTAGSSFCLQQSFWLHPILVVMTLLALLGGFSRVYLSQHFMLDICVGSIIGVTITFLLFIRFVKKIQS